MRLPAIIRRFPIALLFLCMTLRVQGGEVGSTLTSGTRVLMDAHNCYPYDGKWSDRIERALKAGTPLAIEQDLLWYTDKHTGKSWSIVSHGGHASGTEPTMREYFFERIRPIMEEALRQGNHGDWPLVTLNLDFKSDEAAHHAAVLRLLKEYEDWICTAERTADADSVIPLTVKPLLVLTGEADSQERDFYESVPVGERLLVFGAVHVRGKNSMAPAAVLVPDGATNYRRWWNNAWDVVEKGGQRKSGPWTEQDNLRLRELVDHAHAKGLWIRFYTLDGLPDRDLREHGWDKDYNFGSMEKAELRWKAAMDAGVDFLATDQYEDLAKFIRSRAKGTLAGAPIQ
ncbi:MAG: hypothetical protein NVS1B11_21910 [Terriglobales bacterium]